MLGFLKPNVSLVRSLSQLTFLAFCRALWEQAQHSSIQAFIQVYTATRNLNSTTIHTGCYRRDLPHFKSPGGDNIGSKVNGFILVLSWFACVCFLDCQRSLLTITNCRILKLPHTCWMFYAFLKSVTFNYHNILGFKGLKFPQIKCFSFFSVHILNTVSKINNLILNILAFVLIQYLYMFS